MQAIEFETTAYQHSIKIPESVPNGIPIRVMLLFGDISPAPTIDVKALLTTLVDGLSEDDLARNVRRDIKLSGVRFLDPFSGGL